MEKKNVYQLIAQVAEEIGKDGIKKGRKNQMQGYTFRGIDDVYNALSGIISKAGLVILPRVLTRQTEERETKTGGAIFYTFVECEYDIVSAHDQSKHTVRTFGEAMDSADKSTNKAMSAAYKYMAMQTFCIPTEGDNDADATTHEVAPRAEVKKSVSTNPMVDTVLQTAILQCKDSISRQIESASVSAPTETAPVSAPKHDKNYAALQSEVMSSCREFFRYEFLLTLQEFFKQKTDRDF